LALESKVSKVMDIRELYLQVMDSMTDKEAVKRLVTDAKRAVSDLMVAGSYDERGAITDVNVEPTYPTVLCGEKAYTINNPKVLGRHILCHIRLTRDDIDRTVSRAHCILIPFGNEIYIIDPGSCNGIGMETVGADEQVEKDHTNPSGKLRDSRKVLRIPIRTCAKLTLGDVDILINPKKCAICLEHPRTMVFSCGHFIACKKCMPQLLTCPVCRVGFPRMGQLLATKTYIGEEQF
jgi:hypothetical protein